MVATILARIEGTEESARHAYELDPNYIPARRALALALARNGKVEEALALTAATGGESIDHAVRARVLLAAGRPRDAASQARRALERPSAEPVELGLVSEVWREANEVLGLALLREGRTNEALRPLRAAASAGSRAAREELAKIDR